MKTLRYITFTFMLAVLCAAAASAVPWLRDLGRGLKSASREGKPVLVDFYTNWCGWCKKMDQDTYASAAVNRMSSDFIFVKIDGDRHKGIVRKYNVTAYPTTLFLNDKGRVIERVRGYVPPDRFADIMKAVRSSYRPPMKFRSSGRPAEKAGAAAGGFSLTGIIHTSGGVKAIINNKVLGAGDSVAGAEILEISGDSVTLSRDGKKTVLTIE